ncbi:MAG: hypothetical protein JNK77_12890 [Saprospiraceae bacterium]|nr:hypothetical protein [Saprospiraceae bacterium]
MGKTNPQKPDAKSSPDPKLPKLQVLKLRENRKADDWSDAGAGNLKSRPGIELFDAQMPRFIAETYPASLLDEAYHFFNYSDQSNYVKKHNWPVIDFNQNDLTTLRFLLHDAVIDLFEGLKEGSLKQLVGEDILKKMSLETYSKPTKTMHTQDFGRLAVRFLISDAWRPVAAAAKTGTKKSSEKEQKALGRYKRYFDRLDSRLKENRTLLSADNIQRALRDAYPTFFPLLANPNRGKTLLLGWFPASNKPSDVIIIPGLAEKLYGEITHRVFPENPSKKSDPLLPENPFRLPSLIKNNCKKILEEVIPLFGTMPYSGTKIPAFSRWGNIFNALDQIEALFEYPLLNKNTADLSAQVGLPWAMVLTSVLRVYVTELIGTVLKLSMPVKALHAQVNGFAGVALWEALSGKNVQSFDVTGYLAGSLPDSRDAGLLRKINTWTIGDFNGFWRQSKRHETVEKLLNKLGDGTVLDISEKVFAAKSKRVLKPEIDFSIKVVAIADDKGVLSGFPVYPQVFIPNLTVDPVKVRLIMGAMPVAQAHFYVFKFVIDVALNDLKFNYREIFKEEKSFGNGQTLKRPENSKNIPDDFNAPGLPKGLRLGAGSMLFGGHHPPHKTHKDGDTYDCNFPPNTIPWFFDSKIFSELVQTLKDEGTLERSSLVNEKYKELFGIVPTHEAYDKKGGFDIVVFKPLVRSLIQETLKEVIGSVSLSNTAESRAAQYLKAEEKLYGTPHYETGGGAQQRQLGHIAAILSAPRQIIFSSPIVHLRSVFAIEKGLILDPEDKTGLTPIVKMINRIVNLKRGFVFLPNDHNDHWHIEYGKGGTEAITSEEALAHFESFYELWHYIGINFGPLVVQISAFLERIHKNNFSEIPSTYVPRIRDEGTALIESLKKYQKEYQDKQERGNRTCLHDILSQLSYEPDNPLLKPVQGEKPSPEFRKLIKDSQHYIEQILPPAERERFKAEKPSYKELLERYEYFDTHSDDYEADENDENANGPLDAEEE